jgi:multidrug efflux system outer membrane protein
MRTFLGRTALAAIVLGLTAACSTLPEKVSLPDQVPERWSVESPALASRERQLDWWRALQDPQLDAVVAEALRANRDLVAAEARLRAARSLAREARLAQGPSGSAGVQRVRTRTAALSQPPMDGMPAEFPAQQLVDAGVDFRWQLDLAGGLAAARTAAAADAAEMLWRRRQIEAGVAAATVAAWLDRDDANQALQVLQTRSTLLAAVRERLRGAVALGAVREADAAPGELAHENARMLLLERQLQLRNAERRLATLTNRAPGALQWPMSAPAYPALLPVVDPLAALRARPDVGAAEARVQAALARSGVAAAALYPQIALVGAIGLSAPRASLDESGARRYSVGDALTWGLFDLPRLRAQAQAADAQADAELASFHATTLAALEEADAAIDGWQTALDSAQRADAASGAADRAATMIDARRAAGLASALEVARARADALEWQLAAIDARGAARRAWAAALLSLGAGWRDGEVVP